MATYSVKNFLRTPVKGDVTLKIYDTRRRLRFDINPNVAYFFTKSNIITIRIEDRNDIYLDFSNNIEAAEAASKLNDAKKFITKPIIETYSSGLSSEEQRKLAYFHSLSKTLINVNQSTVESRYKSAHNTRVVDLWGSEISPCLTYDDAVNESIVNPAVTLHDKVILSKVPDSDGQAWYFENNGKFIRPWIAPQDIPFDNTSVASGGFTCILYRGDDATRGIPGSIIGFSECAWAVEYYAGIIHFGKGNTPDDLGWGTIKATFFEYTGLFGVEGITDAFTTVIFDSGTSTLVFNSGTPTETSVVITGTGGSPLTIEDEYNNILSNVTHINFVGVDVSAQSAVSGSTNRVNVYIPPPDYASHFNTTDGSTTATVPPISTTQRYIAAPTSEGNPYNRGDWAGGQVSGTIRNSVTSISYSPSGLFSIFNTNTTFTATVYDADGITVLATHTITLNGNSTQTLNNIGITVFNWASDSSKYKADLTVTIGISSILPQGGRFTVSLIHNNGPEGIFTFTQNNIFRDSELLTANISGSFDIIEQVPIIKQVSGVYFYTYGTQFNVSLDGINNLNSNTYPSPTSSQQLRINSTNFFISEVINAHGEDGDFVPSSWNRQYNNTGTQYNKNNWTVNQYNQTNWNHTTGTINNTYGTARLYDWELVVSLNSANYNYLIDTLQDTSTRIIEVFNDETNSSYPRLQSDLSTSWDNTSDLSLTDGGTGLQVLAGRLVYPQYDFSSYLPNDLSQPDYTGMSGDKYYYRRFTGTSNSSNGVIQFSDYNITEADLLSNDVKIDVSYDDTGLLWYSLNSEYAGGVLLNGDGCRVDSAQYGLGTGSVNPNSLRFTLGTGGTSTYIYLRITFTSSASNKYIGQINILDGNWE